jgi:hypothetical protein
MTGSDAERGRNPILLHDLLFIGRHLCHKCLCWNEPELAHLETPDPCIFRHIVGEHVQEILLSHLRSIYRTYSFFLFEKECPRLSNATKKIISKFGHWYLDERDTYIRVFKSTGAPHLLPMYVPDRLVVGEICYQTILQGYNATLVKYKKREFIPYGFHIGFYMLKYTTQAKKEGLSQLEFQFQIGLFRKHDPKGLVLKHASQVSSSWPYTHDRFEDEIFTENAQNWDEVMERMDEPKVTRFKAMSLDE